MQSGQKASIQAPAIRYNDLSLTQEVFARKPSPSFTPGLTVQVVLLGFFIGAFLPTCRKERQVPNPQYIQGALYQC